MNYNELDRGVLLIANNLGISPEEALDKIRNSTLYLKADASIQTSFVKQLALLTALNIGKRCFQRGVEFDIPGGDIPNLLRFQHEDFRDVLREFGGKPGKRNDSDEYLLTFGMPPENDKSFEIICSEWQAGINIFGGKRNVVTENNSCIPVGAMAGASMGVFNAFTQKFGLSEKPLESFGMSLWDMSMKTDWFDPIGNGPNSLFLPNKIWFGGLGHLGQAYLWLYAQLPFDDPKRVDVFLQDMDRVEDGNFGSQVLTIEDDCKKRIYKTDVSKRFLQSCGIHARVSDVPFDAEIQSNEFLKDQGFDVLVTGFDNAKVRRLVDSNRFRSIVDGGTNGNAEDFDRFTVHSFTGDKSLEDVFEVDDLTSDERNFPKVEEGLKERGVACGTISKSVSTPFVGGFTSAIVMAEVLKGFNGAKRNSIVTGRLRGVRQLRCVPDSVYDLDLLISSLNSKFLRATSTA